VGLLLVTGISQFGRQWPAWEPPPPLRRNTKGADLRLRSFVRVFISIIQVDLSSWLSALCGIVPCKGKYTKY